jgi:serine/threonine protein kinase
MEDIIKKDIKDDETNKKNYDYLHLLFPKYEFIKELGKGMMGTVYLIRDKKTNKEFAFKIQHILEKELKKNLESKVWREFEFMTNLGSKYPDHFPGIIDYQIILNCKYKQQYNREMYGFDKAYKDNYQKYSKSPYCMAKIMPIVGQPLVPLLYELKSQERLSIIIQSMYAVYLMRRNHYLHNDLHSRNITIEKTSKKYLNILDFKIPTNGYLVKIIDYDKLLHFKYTLSDKELKEYKFLSSEITRIFKLLIWEKWIDNLIDIKKPYKYPIDFKLMNSSPYIKDIEQYVDPKLPKYYRENYKLLLYRILYPEYQQSTYLKATDSELPFIPPIIEFIDKNDIIFFFQNLSNYHKIIKYFILKTKSLLYIK